ncbi:hypothetical protein F9K33_00565 [bacterium]|nr:MAG: hypothetical protein F9K33_00565 [bacterium]
MNRISCFLRVSVTLVFMVLVVGCEADKKEVLVDAPPIAYVGSETCATADCHPDIYADFVKSGHPYKVQKLNGVAPTFPAGTSAGVPNPPAGTSWTDFEYVIGGYGWKARFLKSDGFVYGTGGNGGGQGLNQYNLATSAFADYNKTSETKYDYNCFICHTTGADPDSAWKPNMFGNFQFTGVQCEECHDKGSQHAFNPEGIPMLIDRTNALCGKCHQRGGYTATVPVNKGFVEHHEQYNELKASPHSNLSCVTCHDPHKGLLYFRDNSNGNMKIECTSSGCHTGKIQNGPHASVDCAKCHMAYTGKSAIAANVHKGDISSHIFKINDTAVPKDSMFTIGSMTGTGSIRLASGKSAGVTLDWACYSCHKDGNNVGGTGSTKSLSELSVYDMHP